MDLPSKVKNTSANIQDLYNVYSGLVTADELGNAAQILTAAQREQDAILESVLEENEDDTVETEDAKRAMKGQLGLDGSANKKHRGL